MGRRCSSVVGAWVLGVGFTSFTHLIQTMYGQWCSVVYWVMMLGNDACMHARRRQAPISSQHARGEMVEYPHRTAAVMCLVRAPRSSGRHVAGGW